jgi:uncharacterized cupin superfamily protein
MASKKPKSPPLLTARHIASMKELARAHRLNPHAIRNSKSLGDAAGMEDLGIHLVRIKSGDLTTEFHTHYCDEEFVYILSGRGIAEIGERKSKIGAGDFMGFVAGSLPHAMSNPYKKDLVYLLGGTRKRSDVSEYPRAGVRTYKFAGQRHTVSFEHATVEKPIARPSKKLKGEKT